MSRNINASCLDRGLLELANVSRNSGCDETVGRTIEIAGTYVPFVEWHAEAMEMD